LLLGPRADTLFEDTSMSCADVCLDHDADAYNDFYNESVVKARKPHKCCECQATIPVGTRYQRVGGKSEGDVWTATSCLPCAEIRKAFVCGSWTFGMLWESIEEGMFPIWDEQGPIDCLAKLETLEARNKAREQYRAWKADA
jgi:hypothetical protein